jgi:hypothetical protein
MPSPPSPFSLHAIVPLELPLQVSLVAHRHLVQSMLAVLAIQQRARRRSGSDVEVVAVADDPDGHDVIPTFLTSHVTS